MTTTARQPDVEVPVVGELGEQWRQDGGQGESGLVCYRAGRVVADSVDQFQSFQRPAPRQAEHPLACRVQGPWRDALPVRRRRDPVAHLARDSLTVQPRMLTPPTR
jgi:hypothetical protein